jgi:tetratricopeptide (TPR) repeat protein
MRDSYWPAVVGSMTLAALVGLAVGLDGIVLFGETVAVAAAATFSWRPMMRRLARRIGAQHIALMEDAIADGDDETYRRLLVEMDEYYRVCIPRSERHRIRLRASGLTAEERYVEALAVLGEIDHDTVPAPERPGHDNSVAWSCAHAGETARAVELASAAVAAVAEARMRPYCLGTLGTALVLDRQPNAALAPLREALALGGPRWAQAVRRYYLGEALAALGRYDEARAEWNESVTIAPKSRFGRRAQERLSAGPPAAYR